MRLTEIHKQPFDLEKFKIDCAPFLKELKGCRKMPFHGTEDSVQDFEVRQFRERTRPRDTPDNVHTKLNAMFKEKVGHEIRNWLFLTGSARVARVYGYIHVIFPIGEYDYAWLPSIDDLTNHRASFLDKAHQKYGQSIPFKEIRDEADEKFLQDVADTEVSVNKDLKECLEDDMEMELHLKCKSFYMFKYMGETFEDIILPFLKSN